MFEEWETSEQSMIRSLADERSLRPGLRARVLGEADRVRRRTESQKAILFTVASLLLFVGGSGWMAEAVTRNVRRSLTSVVPDADQLPVATTRYEAAIVDSMIVRLQRRSASF